MALDVVVPSPGESISEVEIANWIKKSGEYVHKDEEICEIDSDKATLTVSAEASGVLEILVDGGTVEVGAVIARIDTSAAAPEGAAKPAAETPKAEPAAKVEAPKAETVAPAANDSYAKGTPSPAAAKMMAENNIASNNVAGSGPGGRITKADIIQFMSSGLSANAISVVGWEGGRNEERKKMTALRKKIAQRLVSVKNETAMLTTFNEVDMTALMNLRAKYGDKFKEKYGVSLGFMSFFTKAVTEALYHYPAVNSIIDGEEQIFHNYVDVGIAVSTPKGLMVPVLRNAEGMKLHEIEAGIKTLAIKARDGKISVDEMTGGTFTITNGGVFGSLMSTPIINPPQSGILGMHKIQDRPIAVNGKIEIRPMMYLAFSYDHRVIDGKESVGFLVKVKEMIENPELMLFGGKEPSQILVGL